MKKLLLSTLSVALLAGCSSNLSHLDSENALEKWYRYHEDTIHSTKLQDDQALAVFYRTDSVNPTGINVYVNGDYQASVLPNSYSPLAVCVNNALFSSSYVTNKKFGNRVDGERRQLNAGETYYFKLVDSKKGYPVFEAVSAEQAKADLAAANGEIRHTLPRTAGKNCEKIGEKKTLSASALWGLNKHSYADILPQGKKEIREFAAYLNGVNDISRIEISGFTDPEASDAYNQALSERRANTVRQALIKAGVKQEISATGYGETQLVVADCAAKHPTNRKARAACNLPNRRVEITTYVK